MGELADLIRPGSRRGLDFVILDDLRKRTGISDSEILKFSVAEMVANALDTDATEIFIETRTMVMIMAMPLERVGDGLLPYR